MLRQQKQKQLITNIIFLINKTGYFNTRFFYLAYTQFAEKVVKSYLESFNNRIQIIAK